MQKAEALMDDVKSYVDITWTLSTEEEKKLLGMISRGMASLAAKIGDCDFSGETQEKALLLDYVMYARSGALADFWQHYKGEILSLRLRGKVKKYGEEQAVSDF